MNKKKLLSVSFLLLLVTHVGFAQTWEIDYPHSSINFTVNHFFTPITGKFHRFTGSLTFNPDQLSKATFEFTAEVASVNTEDPKRDNHIQSKDFFDARKFPKMTFVSDHVEKKGENSFVAVGKLTIRHVTKDVEIPFQILGSGNHPIKKNSLLMAIKAEFSVNRIDFGVGNGSWSSTAVVGSEVRSVVFLEVYSPLQR